MIMTELEIWNVMHMGLISNSMYFVGMVLMTWLGFRMATKTRDDKNAEMIGKILVSAFFVLVGLSFLNVTMIAGDIISTSASAMALLSERTAGADNLIEVGSSPLNPGGPFSYVFHALIVGMQLLMVWGKSDKA
ncbi:MAG: hypothetical protein MK172_14075 [Verrucomicrobiales bacterium]|nr:hypothetical protein [Verrucomicrobiales bacterium]